MIYHIQGDNTPKIESLVSDLKSKLHIGDGRIIRTNDITNPTIERLLTVAEFVNNKTSDVILITTEVYLVDKTNYKTVSIQQMPFLVEGITELTNSEIINRLLS